MRSSAALLFLLFWLLGCTRGGGDEATARSEAGSAAGRSAEELSQAPPAADAAGDTLRGDWTAGILEVRNAASGVVTLSVMRTATHESFDRFVLEFQGDELPDYHVEYIDRPVRQCGSGNPVELAGDGWLEIRLEPARAHDDEGEATVEQRESSPGLPVILEAKLTCDFEAVVVWVLGVSSPNRYRVTELQSPARLVVDVRK